MKRALLCMLVFVPLLIQAQGTSPAPKFLPLNYEEDYHYLSDKQLRTNLWTQLKYIPTWRGGYITIGGELRLRAEFREHLKYGKGNEDQGWNTQQRTRLWANIHLLPSLRVFAEVQSGTTYNLDYVASLVDHNPGELHQVFAEYTVSLNAKSQLFFRAGRQEILFGKCRLFDVRQPPNNRRGYDAGRIGVKMGDWNFGVIAGEEVLDKAGYFNDPSNKNFKFGAVHVGNKHVELIYLYTDRKGANNYHFNAVRHSVSVRAGGVKGGLNYDVEVVGQFGKNNDGQQIRAWHVGTESIYTFDKKWKPYVGTRTDIASGDRDSTDNKDQAYDYLWSKGASWSPDLGYTNIAAVGPAFGCRPTPKWTIDMTVQELWRVSGADGIYSMPGVQFRTAAASPSTVIGTRCTARSEYQLTPYLLLGGYVNETFRGSYVKKNMIYAQLYSTFRF